MSFPFYREFYQGQGEAVQGTWLWGADAGQTDFASVTGQAAGFYYNSLNNNLDEYKWGSVFLTKGAYKITIITQNSPSRGILEVLFGSRTLGTFDLFNAVASNNNLCEIPFITLTADTTADMRLRCNGKNILSTNEYVDFSRFKIEKTS